MGELILYTTPDGSASMQLKLEGGTVWLSQKEMPRLYQVSIPAIAQHLRNIFESGELRLIQLLRNT
ncbi:hypothetical protein LJC59_08890 [Desulfovibrio sp. OttesenSCG-928-A18]|nr:hypothetical protein [Desulfovibrio sp. OttesenSCG-928-A18]